MRVELDARELHEYAAEWMPDAVAFFGDGERVRTVRQPPAYPKAFVVNAVRGCRRAG